MYFSSKIHLNYYNICMYFTINNDLDVLNYDNIYKKTNYTKYKAKYI